MTSTQASYIRTSNNPDAAADAVTVMLLAQVKALRAQLRALEPQLSKAVAEYGLRRGYRGYREFYMTNDIERNTNDTVS